MNEFEISSDKGQSWILMFRWWIHRKQKMNIFEKKSIFFQFLEKHRERVAKLARREARVSDLWRCGGPTDQVSNEGEKPSEEANCGRSRGSKARRSARAQALYNYCTNTTIWSSKIFIW